MELNSLGWHGGAGSNRNILYQEFSEDQVLHGNAAENIMDAFRRYRLISNPSMAGVQIQTGVELIRLTEKDFEGGQIRRSAPLDDKGPEPDALRLTLGFAGSLLFWGVVVSSGLISVLPWWLFLFLVFFNLTFIVGWAIGETGEDASRPPESNQRRRQAIPEQVRHAVWRRDEGRCVECGSKEKLEFDHIIPWSKGGSDTERNLQLLCESCNRQKGASI